MRIGCGKNGGVGRCWRRVVPVIAGGLLLAACSRSGDVSGEFYYATRGGDVKRLGDQQVVLVKATPEFEAAWGKAVAEFKEPNDPLKGGYEEARRAHALELIKWGKTAETRTSSVGRFEFRGVPAGRYYLFASAEVPIALTSYLHFARIYWWVPVVVKPGAQTADLTMNNTGEWPFN